MTAGFTGSIIREYVGCSDSDGDGDNDDQEDDESTDIDWRNRSILI